MNTGLVMHVRNETATSLNFTTKIKTLSRGYLMFPGPTGKKMLNSFCSHFREGGVTQLTFLNVFPSLKVHWGESQT